MNTGFLSNWLRVAAALFLVSGASALNFEIPKELQDEAEAQKAAEAAERQEAVEALYEGKAEAEDGAAMSFGSEDAGAELPADNAPSEGAFDESDFLEFDPNSPTGTALGDNGMITGQIFDKESSQSLSGVAILIEGTDIGSITDGNGTYTLGPIEAGTYTLNFLKTGYIEANVTEFEVVAGESKEFGFALPPRPAEMSDEVFELQDFVVTADEASQMMQLIELKQASVGEMDFLSAEDFDKFGGSNIADFVSRLAGVNVVEGQFAVVRGLGDRYNSTLVNNLPVPSPDPVRQGVQLDLFPTSVVESVIVEKAFVPSRPSTSSGAAFNLVTRSYPEEFSAWFELGVSANDNAQDDLLRNRNVEAFQGTPGGDVFDLDDALGRADRRPSGTEFNAYDDSVGAFGGQSYKVGFGNTIETPWGGSVGFVNSLSYSSSSTTRVGSQQDRYGENSFTSPFPVFFPSIPGSATAGTLPGRGLQYDFTESEVSEDSSFLLGVGTTLDRDEKHKLDLTYLRSRSNISIAARRENGFLTQGNGETLDRGFAQNTFSNRTLVLADEIVGRGNSDVLTQGQDILSFEQRTLEVKQFSGSHIFEALGKDLITFDWGASLNKAQSEIGDPNGDSFVGGQSSLFYLQNVSGGTLSGSLGTPAIPLPEPIADGGYLFGGDTAISDGFTEDVLRSTARTIDDEHDAYRADVTIDATEKINFVTGIYYEDLERDVLQRDQVYTINGDNVTSGDTLGEFVDGTVSDGSVILTDLNSFAKVTREVTDAYFELDVSPLDKFDFVLGARHSTVEMTSEGSSFLVPGRPLTGEPGSFTEALLVGNSNLNNGDLLGFGSPNPEDAIVKGDIDEDYWLPAFTMKYAATDNLSLRFSYSQTYALPSARELSPVFTVDTFTGDRVVGNPTLQISEIENFGASVGYTFDDGVSSFSVSVFRKEIDDPIEQIGLNDSLTGIDVQSFINNENSATVEGIELEGRLGLGLLEELTDWIEVGFLKYFSLGGNVAFIDAEVDYPQAVIDSYLNANTGESIFADGNGNLELPTDRRLYDQPEWTANFDITFEHPEWGTRVTAAIYAQSDVLSSVGTGSSLAVDQYTSSYNQFDLVASQSFGDGWEFEFSVENLTDTKRGIEYTDDFVDEDTKRFSYRVGRSFGMKAKYSF